jgi:hypothetical protein
MNEDSSRIERIEDKIDKVIDRLSVQNVRLSQQDGHLIQIKADLQLHMRRTRLLERHVAPLRTLYKVAGISVSGLAIVAMVFEILGYFKHGK